MGQIFQRMDVAVENGNWSLKRLLERGMPKMEDPDKRLQWLYECQETFSNVQETIEFLKTL